MDFDWPLKMIWKGYWNPYDRGVKCLACDNTGYNKATQALARDVLGKILVDEARRLGVYGYCSFCKGHGHVFFNDNIEKLHQAWYESERYDPPIGDGFQLWETTSEGSPASPIFSSLDELCAWCAEHATTFGSFKATAEDWKKMLEEDNVYHQEGNMVFL